MLFIEGIKIEAFSPRMTFVNHTSVCDDKYGYLERAIARSKVHRDGHNYLIGEDIQLKNEYMEFANNTLIVAEKDDEFKFILILKGKVFDVVEDINDTNVKMLLSTNKFSVMDSYGKELLIHNHDELVEFVDAVKSSRRNFNISLESYHRYMDMLFEFRNQRTNEVNCFISEDYNKLLKTSDEFAKEMIDMLNAYRESDEHKIVQRFIHRPSDEEKKCVLFGLYIAVLRAYKLNYDYDDSSMTLDEKIRNKFQKELNYFIADNDDIFEIYTKYFALRPVEIDEIRELLKEEGIDGGDWNMEPSEINIL